MKRIFTKIIGLLCFFMLFLANVQAQQDTVYVYQKDASLYKMSVSQIDSIRYTTPSGDNTFNIYDQGSIVYSKAVKDIDSITFYYTETPPVVPVPTFMLSFNGNGHTSGTVPVSQTADSGAIVKAPAHGDLAKTGYDFVAWNTAMNGTGTTYAAASNITLKSVLTLYAQWTENTASNTTTITVNGLSFEMVSVQGGSFTMGCTSEQGSDCFDDEKPTYTVSLSDYYIGQFEVTQELWKAVMGNNPSNFKGDSLPVEQVSWDDCQGFISELNRLTAKTFALPTEAQWEYAARGGSKSQAYKYAGGNSIADVACYFNNSASKTHEGGTKSANELGIYDMSGNVYEWCSDWFGNYTSGSQTNPSGPSSGSARVNRGGSWGNGAPGCRVSYRGNESPDFRGGISGFRLVLVE